MYRKMLCTGNCKVVFWVVALEAAYKFYSKRAGEKRIFTVRLLPPSPPRISENVDIRRPDSQALEADVIGCSTFNIELGASLSTNDIAHTVY